MNESWFKKSLKEGRGRQIFSSGTAFECENYHEGLRCGYGTKITNDFVIKVKFENDELNGIGRTTWNDTEVFYG